MSIALPAGRSRRTYRARVTRLTVDAGFSAQRSAWAGNAMAARTVMVLSPATGAPPG